MGRRRLSQPSEGTSPGTPRHHATSGTPVSPPHQGMAGPPRPSQHLSLSRGHPQGRVWGTRGPGCHLWVRGPGEGTRPPPLTGVGIGLAGLAGGGSFAGEGVGGAELAGGGAGGGGVGAGFAGEALGGVSHPWQQEGAQGAGTGGGRWWQAPPACTHLPVMPMFLTSTGLGTLDHTEKAVVRQYSTLLPRLSSTWKRDGGCWGGGCVLGGSGVGCSHGWGGDWHPWVGG